MKMPSTVLPFSAIEPLFPFYFRTDGEGVILSIGPSLKKLTGQGIVGENFNAHFKFLRPGGIDLKSGIGALSGEMVILQVGSTNAKLMGQILELKESSELIFIVSLSVQEAGELSALSLNFNDFAIQDQIFDFLMLLQTHRRAISEAEKLNLKLSAASKMKSQFLANMSHELRTPMNGVLGMASVLSETNLDEIQKECVDTIVQSGDSMLRLINDILDLSKIEAGHLELIEQGFQLEDVIRSATQTLKVAAESKAIDFQIQVEPGIPAPLIGDEPRLQQVLLNLIGNAVKFTESGSVTIEVRNLEKSDLSQTHLEFTIRDTGIGMSPEVLGQIFSPFVQGDSSMTKKFEGTGLGLSICKRIVESMGGVIRAKSTLGVGSEFQFTASFKRGRV